MKRFTDKSNTHFRYSDAEKLLSNSEAISDMIELHQQEHAPRLRILRDYYKGDNVAVLEGDRRKEEHLADNRATHNFAKYVSQFIQGYMMGVPLKTSYPDDKVDELIRDINRINDADEHNAELVLDQSIYGRAYELINRNQDHEIRLYTLDVLETFVIYDDTVECKPIAAVRYIGNQFEDDSTVYVYTTDLVRKYSMDDGNELSLKEENEHYFDGVPIIEYENNKYRQGDFEDVLTLIDLYDASQSDTANYSQDLNDAMLVIKGNVSLDVDEAKAMKDANLLFLQTEMDADGKSGQADADYIYKKYDVAGTEAYKDRLFNNILLFTSIPNLLDDKQSGQGSQSGEALKMKLFALSQKRATKERLFKRSLRDRYRMIDNILSVASEGSFDVNEISITFTENLPSMIDKELEWFGKMGGQLSNQTMLEQLSFIESAKEEMELIEEEDGLNAETYDFQTVEVDVDEEE